MRNALVKLVLAASVTLVLGVNRAQADVIVSNLSAPVGGSGGIYPAPQPQEYAQEFTTGNQAYMVGTVIAQLGAASGTFTPFAELVTNAAGVPSSTVLTTFSVPTIGTAYSNLTMTPAANVMLSANTSYWFVLGEAGTGTYRWSYTDNATSSISTYANSHDNGATWTPFNNGPFLIEVDSAQISAVPEPSTLALSGLAAVIGIGVLRRRRTKAVAA